MARIRTIKPEFWTDEKVVECSPTARLLFIGLWNFADDYGNLERSSKQIKIRIFPADAIDIEPHVQELIQVGLVREYEVDGCNYLHIKGFRKHQKIEKPSNPRHPLPEPSVSPRGVLGEPSGKMALDQGRDQGREGIKDQGMDQGENPSWSSPGDNDRRRKGKKRQIDIFNPEALRLSELFAERILSNNPDFRELKPEKREKTLHAWSTEISRMIRIDGRDPPEIEQVIRWCQADTFWKSNILSAKKLREQYDRLKLQAQRGGHDGQRAQGKNGPGAGDVKKPGKYAHLGVRINLDSPPSPDAGAAPQGGGSEEVPKCSQG